MIAVAAVTAGFLGLSLSGATPAGADDTLLVATVEADVSVGGQSVLEVDATAASYRDGDSWILTVDVVRTVAGTGPGHTWAGNTTLCASGSTLAAAECTVLDTLADLT